MAIAEQEERSTKRVSRLFTLEQVPLLDAGFNRTVSEVQASPLGSSRDGQSLSKWLGAPAKRDLANTNGVAPIPASDPALIGLLTFNLTRIPNVSIQPPPNDFVHPEKYNLCISNLSEPVRKQFLSEKSSILSAKPKSIAAQSDASSDQDYATLPAQINDATNRIRDSYTRLYQAVTGQLTAPDGKLMGAVQIGLLLDPKRPDNLPKLFLDACDNLSQLPRAAQEQAISQLGGETAFNQMRAYAQHVNTDYRFRQDLVATLYRKQTQARDLQTSAASLAKPPVGVKPFYAVTDFVSEAMLPISSIENLFEKGNNPHEHLTVWDWAWAAVDVGLTIAEVKTVYKAGKLVFEGGEYLAKKTVRHQLEEQLAEKYADNPAKAAAGVRYAYRKAFTESEKMASKTEEEYVEKLVEKGREGAEKYATKPIVKKGVEAGVEATGWQKTKSVAMALQGTTLTAFTLRQIERATELAVSAKLPDWVVAENPQWKKQGHSDEQMRQLALTQTRMDLSFVFGTFEVYGLTSQAIRSLASTRLSPLLNEAARMEASGQDSGPLFQKELPSIIKEGGVVGAPAQIDDASVQPLVKIAKAMAQGAKNAGLKVQGMSAPAAWLFTTPPGEMGVFSTAALTYWNLSSNSINNIQQDLLQTQAAAQITPQYYAPYRNVGAQENNGAPISNPAQAKAANEENIYRKFHHISPDALPGTNTPMLLDFVPNALVINMDDPATLARVTQGDSTHAPIPPERFNRFVLIERSLGVVPSAENELSGDYDQLNRLLLHDYEPGALDNLYSRFKGRPLVLWLDIETMASSWIKNPALMEQQLPADHAPFSKQWDEQVLHPAAPDPSFPMLSGADLQMTVAMKLILTYVLRGYLQPLENQAP